MDVLNSAIVLLNHWGQVSCDFAGRMLLQSGILIGLLLIADRCLRSRVCACFRYGMWLLVLLKLMLPPSLALPTSITYWLGGYAPTAPAVSALSTPAVIATPAAHIAFFAHVGATPAPLANTAIAASQIVPLQWPGLLLLGWIAGVALLVVLILRRVALARRSLRRSHPADGQMIALLEECRDKLGITAQVTLRLSKDMHSPCLCGFLRPVILLPAVLPAGLGQAALRTILAHELAHVKRRDPWVSLAQTVLQVAYFWHPLVWVANTRLRLLREQAVDETVVATLRCQAQCYTDTLINIAEMAFRKPAFSLRLIGIAESKSALERRITHMSNQRIMKHPTLRLSGLLLILVIGALLVPMGRGHFTARAQQQAVQNAPALPPEVPELFQLNKDQILARFGEPKRIYNEDKTYTLQNLPQMYYMAYDDITFVINDDTVVGILLLGPHYVFGNGIRVGDSKAKVKQAFGTGSTLEETEAKDFLDYEEFGVRFEIDKQSRSVTQIDISCEYGDPVLVGVNANDPEFTAKLPERIAKLNIDTANLEQVIATFGTPLKYIWGSKTFTADQLPDRFIAMYPSSFRVFMMDNKIVELRHEGNGSKYVYTGGLHVGSTLEEALAVLGAPMRTVEGQGIDWQDSKDVLFKDIDGRKGHCYYHRPQLKVRVWFADYKIAAIYMTRSDYGEDSSSGGSVPSDAEFEAKLSERIAKLNIDTADLAQVIATFGTPAKYIWGSKTFSADKLPDRFIAMYPGAFHVFMMNNQIVELRHEHGSKYVYLGGLHVGSTLEEALAVLGTPVRTVEGQAIDWQNSKDVLFKNIDGRKGYGYYHRPELNVRVWFASNKISAIYMTRSDYGQDSSSVPFDAEFARLLADRITRLNIDTAGLQQVKEIFGEPTKYIWGNKTFTADALPDCYIMVYPCDFSVWLRNGKIMEIRHERGSAYLYRGKLRIGSSLQEVLDLLGEPAETVTGKENAFKDKILYLDIDGTTGHDYYHRSDQKVRIWLWENKVIAIYMTRSDFAAGN